MLRIALPNKGSLSEGALAILRDAGYQCKRYGRELAVLDAEHDTEFVFLRPRDIAVYVGRGIIDAGITGRDLAQDSGAEVMEILPLNFARSRFCYAVPKDSGLVADKFTGLRVATSYSRIVRQDLASRGVEAEVVRLDGAVEISIQLGVADVIADVVESGRTLQEAGLAITGEPLMQSEAILIARTERLKCPEVLLLKKRINGILMARSFCVVEYVIPRALLVQACEITPGVKSPTVSPLSDAGWVAVKAMIKRNTINRIIDELAAVGAEGIIISEIQTCRL